MMKRPVAMVAAILCVGLVFVATSCAGAPAPTKAVPPLPPSGSGTAPSAKPAAPANGSAVGSDSSSTASQGTGDRMVIRNAFVRLVVKDVDNVLSQAAALAGDVGGYVVSSESQEQNGERVGRASLRVPADQADEALRRVKGMAIKVNRETTGSQDVTEEYVDQEARLRALKATEEQYLELMRGTRTTEDIIKVQQSLGQVREQIERTQGRMLYLQRNTAMALISLELYTAGAARPLDGGGWDAQEVLNAAVRGLVSVGMVLAGLAIWVAVFVPVWGPFVLLLRWWRRRSRTPAQAGGA